MSKINVSEKNTKTEILEAYTKLQAELVAKNAVKIDPVVEAQVKRNTAVVEKVESFNVEGLSSIVSKIDADIFKVTELLKEYENVKNAIAVKNAELKEMFEIEKAAYTLAALINSQNEVQTKFDEDFKAKRALADQKLFEVNVEIDAKKAELKAEIEKMNSEAKETRKKEEADYKYATDRIRRISEENFQDDMNKKKREMSDYVAAQQKIIDSDRVEVEARETAIAIKEFEIEKMERRIEEFPSELETARQEGEKIAAEKAKTSNGFEVRYLKKEYEGDVNLLNNKINTLTENLDDSKERIATLSSKLDEAYGRIENMASKTVDGASSAKLVSTLEAALKEKNTTSGK